MAALLGMKDLWILELHLLPEAYNYRAHEFRVTQPVLKMLKLRCVVIRAMLESDNGSGGQEEGRLFQGVLTSRRKTIGILST